MERNINLQRVSDGKKYRRNDMAKLGCRECAGCSECCHKVGDSIVLDPWDVYMLTTHLAISFEGLMEEEKVALGVVDGMILPHIQIKEEETGCSFLNEEGRCSIHPFRPGLCRLFPLGRLYEDEGFSYFLQTQECRVQKRSKVKISKWLQIPELERYEKYVNQWHHFGRGIQSNARKMEEEVLKNCNMHVLQNFFVESYEEEDFYGQFERRLARAKAELGMA